MESSYKKQSESTLHSDGSVELVVSGTRFGPSAGMLAHTKLTLALAVVSFVLLLSSLTGSIVLGFVIGVPVAYVLNTLTQNWINEETTKNYSSSRRSRVWEKKK